MEVSAPWLCLLSVLHLLCVLRLARSQVNVDGRVFAILGSDVTLKCQANLEDIRQVTWLRVENGRDENFLLNNTDGLKKLNDFARERVDFLGNGPTEGSIRIRNVQLADETEYTCVFTISVVGPKKGKTSLTVLVPADTHVDPTPGPVLPRIPYETVATCMAEAGKPAAKISWQTDGLAYNTSETVIQHANKTTTIQSQLRMEPIPAINRRNVTCIIVQDNGIAEQRTEQRLTLQNIYYPPVVRVEMRTWDNGTVQFICVEDANPAATSYSWRRMEANVTLGNGKVFSGEGLQGGLYICEVTNPVGTSSGYLYFYSGPDSHRCLHAWLWPFLLLLLMSGILAYMCCLMRSKEDHSVDFPYSLCRQCWTEDGGVCLNFQRRRNSSSETREGFRAVATSSPSQERGNVQEMREAPM